MKITGICIEGFGKFHNYSLDFKEGVNVISGANEAGKSTMHAFIRSMLYGASVKKKGGRKSLYERMRPWDTPDVYGGSMTVDSGEGRFRIERNFADAPDDIKVYDLNGVSEIKVKDTLSFMTGILGGLSETAYDGTVSLKQLGAAAKRDMADEIRRYAANVGTTANPRLNAQKAVEHLEKEKQGFEALIDEDAVKEYNQTLGRIKAVESGLKDPGNINRITEIKQANAESLNEADETSKNLAESEMAISSYENELKETGFSGKKDAESARNEAESVYAEYKDKKQALPVYIIAGLIAIAAAVCGALSVFYDIFGIMDSISEYKHIIIIISVAAFAFGVTALFEAVMLLRSKKSLKTEFSGIYSKYLPGEMTADISDEGMEKLSEKLGIYVGKASEMDDEKLNRDKLIGRLKDINDEQSRQLKALGEQQAIRDKVEGDLKLLNDLKKNLNILELKIERNKELRDKAEAAELAGETIGELSDGIMNAAGTYINKNAGVMVKGLTGGAYDSVNAGADYDIYVNSPDGMRPVEALSQGTMDQVYMAVRLAAIRFIAGEDDSMPLVMDDSFALYDDERLKAAIGFLTENYKGQMLIFTCQQREREALIAAGNEFNDIEI